MFVLRVRAFGPCHTRADRTPQIGGSQFLEQFISMTAAAMVSFPLQELARNQTLSYRNQSLRLRFQRRVAAAVTSIASRLAARLLLHSAQRYAQMAIWFRGARDRMENEPQDREIDPRDSLRALLDDLEVDLTEAYAEGLECQRELSKLGREGRVFAACGRLAQVADELRLEVRAFKGAVQAHDANVNAMQKARRVATTLEELNRDLESHAV